MAASDRADVVRRALAAAERGDREELFELLQPGVEWQMIGLLASRQPVYRGREEIWAYVCALHEQLGDFESELLEVSEVGTQVVARVRLRGGRHGDQALDLEFSIVMRVEQGRIVHADNYEDHDEALTDAELRIGPAG